jgi:hypothetical protein
MPASASLEKNVHQSSKIDLGCLAAGFNQFFFRTPVTWIQESASHSPKWFKRTFPHTYYYLTLRPVKAWTTHLNTDVHLLSFPKCGRTWLRQMLGRALTQHFELGEIDPSDLRRLSRLHPQIPTMYMHHDDDIFWKTPSELTPHRTWYRSKKVLLLVREPKDVIVSSYFQKAKRENAFTGTLSQFLQEEKGSYKTLIEYYNIWHRNAEVPNSFLCISYEQLHADTIKTLRRVLNFLGISDIQDAVIEEAVHYASFAQMRKREMAIGTPISSQGECLKTRKGKVGGNSDYLSPEEIKQIDEYAKNNLLKGSIARKAWTLK